MKVERAALLFFHPLRRITFQLPNQLGHLDRLPDTAEDMNVVFDSTDDDGRTLELVARSGEIGVGPRTEFFVR